MSTQVKSWQLSVIPKKPDARKRIGRIARQFNHQMAGRKSARHCNRRWERDLADLTTKRLRELLAEQAEIEAGFSNGPDYDEEAYEYEYDLFGLQLDVPAEIRHTNWWQLGENVDDSMVRAVSEPRLAIYDRHPLGYRTTRWPCR